MTIDTTANLQSAASQVASAMLHTAQTASSASTSASSSANPSAGSSGITSTDFLSLLVSELKNQDPTQPTDPNAYVQQLVGVNSLQQLISINQELGNANATPSTTPGVTAAV